MALALKTLEDYDRGRIREQLVSAVGSLGGFDPILADKQRILIKPNFVIPQVAEKCGTTHPAVYMAIAEILLELGKDVTIGESPAFGSVQRALRLHRVLDECSTKGIKVLTFAQAREVEGTGDHPYRRLTIAAELQSYDAIINVPKLKVHQQFVFTGATKNLYGCVTGKRKAYRHFTSGNDLVKFAKMIHRTADAVAPCLNIGDGIQALHRHGPINGEPYPLHRLIVSDSYLEFDWLFARMIGLQPESTPLFAVCNDDRKTACEAAFQELKAQESLPDTAAFLQAKVTPIGFSLAHMVRSIMKTITRRR